MGLLSKIQGTDVVFWRFSVYVFKSMFGIWSLGQKKALFRHFSTFFQLRSPAMRHQKGKKLTKNSSFLPQALNPKHALRGDLFSN
jgi:hypothetical protein